MNMTAFPPKLKKVYFLGFCQKASGAKICIEDGVVYIVKLHKNI